MRKTSIPITLTEDLREAIRLAANELGSNSALATAAKIHYSQPGKYISGKVSTISEDTYLALLPYISRHMPPNTERRPVPVLTMAQAAELGTYDLANLQKQTPGVANSAAPTETFNAPDSDCTLAFRFDASYDPDCHHAQDGDLIFVGRPCDPREPNQPYLCSLAGKILFRRIFQVGDKLTLVANGRSVTVPCKSVAWFLPVLGIYRKM